MTATVVRETFDFSVFFFLFEAGEAEKEIRSEEAYGSFGFYGEEEASQRRVTEAYADTITHSHDALLLFFSFRRPQIFIRVNCA